MVLTTIFGYAFLFVALAVVLLLILVQNVLGNQRIFDPLIKFICKCVPFVFGIRVRVTGKRHVDRSSSCMFMANHVNILDPVILYGYIPNFTRAVELEDHFSWPIWGTITKRAGNIPISHRHVSSALESLKRAEAMLHRGVSIIILPEGHRTRDGNLGRFMRGPFRLARSVKADIIPVALKDLFKRKNVHSLLVRPGSMCVAFGAPIAPGTEPELNEHGFRDLVREEIQRLIEEE